MDKIDNFIAVRIFQCLDIKDVLKNCLFLSRRFFWVVKESKWTRLMSVKNLDREGQTKLYRLLKGFHITSLKIRNTPIHFNLGRVFQTSHLQNIDICKCKGDPLFYIRTASLVKNFHVIRLADIFIYKPMFIRCNVIHMSDSQFKLISCPEETTKYIYSNYWGYGYKKRHFYSKKVMIKRDEIVSKSVRLYINSKLYYKKQTIYPEGKSVIVYRAHKINKIYTGYSNVIIQILNLINISFQFKDCKYVTLYNLSNVALKFTNVETLVLKNFILFDQLCKNNNLNEINKIISLRSIQRKTLHLFSHHKNLQVDFTFPDYIKKMRDAVRPNGIYIVAFKNRIIKHFVPENVFNDVPL